MRNWNKWLCFKKICSFALLPPENLKRTGSILKSQGKTVKTSRVNLQSFGQERKKFAVPRRGGFAGTSYMCSPHFLTYKPSVQRDPALQVMLAQLSSVQLFCMQVKAAFGIHNLVLKLVNEETQWSVAFYFKSLKAKKNSEWSDRSSLL